MADKIIGLQVQADTGAAETSVKSLKQQLKDATNEVANMAEKFGETSEQAVLAAKKAADLKDKIGDAKSLTDAFNPDAKFNALSGSLQAVTGGFSAVTGAMALLGVESDDVQQTLLKVQAALAISEGVNSIIGAKDAFRDMKVVALNAFKGIKTAIGETGIGLLVLAIGAIAANWDKIKSTISGVTSEQLNLNDAAQANAKAEQDKLTALNGQDNILKLQGMSEKEILNLKIKQTDETIVANEAALQSQVAIEAAQIKTAKRNQEILAGILSWLIPPLHLVAATIDAAGSIFGKNFGAVDKLNDLAKQGASFLFDPDKVQADGAATIQAQLDTLKKLNNDRAGYQLQINDIDKKAADTKAANAKEETDAILKERERLGKAAIDIYNKNKTDNDKRLADEAAKKEAADVAANDAEFKAQEDAENKSLDITTFYNKLKTQNDKANTEERKALRKQEYDNAVELASKIGDVLNKASEIAGRNTVAGKVLAIASAVIDTYKAANTALAASPPPFNIINAALVAAVGFKNVQGILKTKIPGVAGDATAAVPAIDTSAPTIAAPAQQGTTLDQNSINAIGQASSRAYVISTDIDNDQQRTATINRAARIG